MTWDAIVIGSGFGGAMAAHALVAQGHNVLMMERGGWVGRAPDNWGKRGAAFVSTHFSWDSPYRVEQGWRSTTAGAVNCVGGQSVFYGGASFRYRESDFEHNDDIVGESGAEWPFRYRDLEKSYCEAERLLGVAGEAGNDCTEPHRTMPFAGALTALAPSSQAISDAAERLGMHPSRIPLAISFGKRAPQAECIRCGKCDGYACAAEAKNDIATRLIPSLLRSGMTLRTNAVCVKLLHNRTRVTGVEYVDRNTGQRGTEHARAVVLAAGSLATPHLILASGLRRLSTAPAAVGQYLTRHKNSVVFGLFRQAPNRMGVFDKQVAITDFYHGLAKSETFSGPLGMLQQMTPPEGLVRATIPGIIAPFAAAFLAHSTGLVAMTEDQPRIGNGVEVDERRFDQFGLPQLVVRHKYSARDAESNRLLVQRGREIMREAGAILTYAHPIRTFSHALGTVRMGCDEETAPLDGEGRYRGLDNLFVADGSALPRAASVNPSLTIAANALRIGSILATSLPRVRVQRQRLPLFATRSLA